jgi:hypothetical protein
LVYYYTVLLQLLKPNSCNTAWPCARQQRKYFLRPLRKKIVAYGGLYSPIEPRCCRAQKNKLWYKILQQKKGT